MTLHGLQAIQLAVLTDEEEAFPAPMLLSALRVLVDSRVRRIGLIQFICAADEHISGSFLRAKFDRVRRPYGVKAGHGHEQNGLRAAA